MPTVHRASLACAALAALMAIAARSAPEKTGLVAYLSRSGDLTVRRVDTDAVVATVRPGLFETTWQYRGVSPASSAASGRGPTEGVIRAGGGRKPVRVRGEAGVEQGQLRLRYALTPEAPLTVNSAHVSVNLPATPWVGASLSPSTAGTVVPEQAGKTQLLSGDLKEITLTKGAARVRVRAEGQPLMLQDNRVFGSAELEVRIGRQSGEGRAWESGRAEQISFSLDFGEPVTLEQETPVTLQTGSDWVPLDLKLDIAPGSALELSSLTPAPAGSQGWVVARPDGHFGFERGNGPVRFYGANLCYSANYLEKADADRLAQRFAATGYNTVRLHHYEGDLIDSKAPDSLTLRADNLDRLDYLVAAFKKRGIYVKTDLYVSRPVRPAEAPSDNFKMALLVSDRALENWKAFSGKLLRHVNPYTRVAWKDDPAIAWLSVVNEGNGLNYLGSLNGELRTLFEIRWQAWLRAKYGTDTALRTAWADPPRPSPLPCRSQRTALRAVATWQSS